MRNRWAALPAVSLLVFTACSRKAGENQPWSELNSQLIKKHNIKTRERLVPQTDVPLGFAVLARRQHCASFREPESLPAVFRRTSFPYLACGSKKAAYLELAIASDIISSLNTQAASNMLRERLLRQRE